MDKEKKGGLIIALGGPEPKLSGKKDMPSPMGKDEDDEGGMGMDEAAMSAMEDFIAAVHAKDAAGAMAAYSDLCDAHGMMGE